MSADHLMLQLERPGARIVALEFPGEKDFNLFFW